MLCRSQEEIAQRPLVELSRPIGIVAHPRLDTSLRIRPAIVHRLILEILKSVAQAALELAVVDRVQEQAHRHQMRAAKELVKLGKHSFRLLVQIVGHGLDECAQPICQHRFDGEIF